MNVYDLLTMDHKRVRDIFSAIAGTKRQDKERRDELFLTLRQELISHAHAEQKLFYSALEDKEPTHDLIQEGLHEHQEIESMLSEIEGISVEDEEWLPKIHDLQERVEHHVEEEEQIIFPKARHLIAEDAAEQMVEEVEKVESQEKSQIH